MGRAQGTHKNGGRVADVDAAEAAAEAWFDAVIAKYYPERAPAKAGEEE